MNKRLLAIRFLPLLILFLAMSTYAYLKMSKPERVKPVAKEKVWQVDVIAAQPQTLSPTLTLYGEVETPALVKAAAPGPGLVAEVLVSPGDQVQQAQKLVSMDSRDFAAANLQAQADVADIEAQIAEHELRYRSDLKSVEEEKNLLELAKKEVKRIESLKRNNLSSDSALSDARELLGRQELSLISKQLEVARYPTTRQQLQARLDRARARLAETELAIERSEVIAGFDAVVAEVPVTTGDRVQVSEVLVSLYPVDSLEVRARIPSSYQGEIQNALELEESLMAVAEYAGRDINLQLIRLAGTADPSGIDAYFRINNGASRLRIGNMIKIELQRPLQHQVIAVPFRAIYGNNRLFLLQQGRMRAIDVESVGQYETAQGESLLLVRSGQIQAGDQVIVTHLPNAVDGLRVRVTGEDPSGDQANAA